MTLRFMATIQKFFEGFGWITVFFFLSIYILRNYVIKHKKSNLISSENSGLSISDADRKAKYDTKKKKVRVYQQLDVYKASREAYHSMEEGFSDGRTMYNNKSTGVK
mmetsp:Transcript_1613/g.1754  ORF Transcript_1613/g.1754 Transcript_1613/m.1754 type:complete len:107 (+) Transcript_1613:258-578(+)